MPADRLRDALPPPDDSDDMLRPEVGAPPAEPEPYAAGARVRPAGALCTRGALPVEPYERPPDTLRGGLPPCVPRLVGADRIAERGSADVPPAGPRVAVRGAEK